MKFKYSLTVLCGILLWETITGDRINYSGYRLARIYPENEEQWTEVKSLKEQGVL